MTQSSMDPTALLKYSIERLKVTNQSYIDNNMFINTNKSHFMITNTPETRDLFINQLSSYTDFDIIPTWFCGKRLPNPHRPYY